jgi:hypothetical protein
LRTVFTLRATLLGLASWLIPFALSFFFFDRIGQLLIPQPLLRLLMQATCMLVCVLL